MNLYMAVAIIKRFSEQLDEKEAIRVPTTSGLHQALAYLTNWFRDKPDLFDDDHQERIDDENRKRKQG